MHLISSISDSITNSSINNDDIDDFKQYYFLSGAIVCLSVLTLISCCFCTNNKNKYDVNTYSTDNYNENILLINNNSQNRIITTYKINDQPPPPYERPS